MTDNMQYRISGGPSREELFDGLRLRHEGRKVNFMAVRHIGDSNPTIVLVGCTVNGIQAEDGSGHKWIVLIYQFERKLGSDRLELQYNTNTRKGWVRPAERKEEHASA